MSHHHKSTFTIHHIETQPLFHKNPRAMRRDRLVYVGHEPNRLAQGDDDFLVVLEVGVVEGWLIFDCGFLIFDWKIGNCRLGDAAEILGGVDVHAAGGFVEGHPVNLVGAFFGEVGDEVVEPGGLQEVEGVATPEIRVQVADVVAECIGVTHRHHKKIIAIPFREPTATTPPSAPTAPCCYTHYVARIMWSSVIWTHFVATREKG